MELIFFIGTPRPPAILESVHNKSSNCPVVDLTSFSSDDDIGERTADIVTAGEHDSNSQVIFNFKAN
jgi:hypothetical protein